MVSNLVTRGLTENGSPCTFYMDGNLKKNLNNIIDRVRNKNWDFVCIIAGLPGAGKSNFSQSCARYCCEWFSRKYIAFSDEDFIRITNECEEYSSVCLDESFASFNAKVSNSKSFLRIINHLQLIRQKHLFIYLNLPDFFDLNKGVALYRSSFLFLVYDREGYRGHFAAFDRDEKQTLYIKGQKFHNYYCVRANFIGRFTKQRCINEKKYEAMKLKHLKEQNSIRKEIQVPSKVRKGRDNLVKYLIAKLKTPKKDVAKLSFVDVRTVHNIMNDKDEL